MSNATLILLTTNIYPTPDTSDSNDVRWIDQGGVERGFGYMSKQGDKSIHIVRCPMCENENYLHQTICITCGFDPNPEEEKSE